MPEPYRLRSVANVLTQPAGIMRRLVAKSHTLMQLNQALDNYLEAPLKHHCRIADYSSHVVVLHADSPVWSAKLRYRTPSILDFLRRECQLAELTSSEIRVRPPRKDFRPSQSRRLALSRTASELVRSAAAGTRDPDLRAALIRLSQHTK